MAIRIVASISIPYQGIITLTTRKTAAQSKACPDRLSPQNPVFEDPFFLHSLQSHGQLQNAYKVSPDENCWLLHTLPTILLKNSHIKLRPSASTTKRNKPWDSAFGVSGCLQEDLNKRRAVWNPDTYVICMLDPPQRPRSTSTRNQHATKEEIAKSGTLLGVLFRSTCRPAGGIVFEPLV